MQAGFPISTVLVAALLLALASPVMGQGVVPLGSEVLVGSPDGLPEALGVSVSMNSAGRFVVVWRANYSGTDRLRAQVVGPANEEIGSDVLVTDLVGSDQEVSASGVGIQSDGEFVVAWTDIDTLVGPGTGYGVVAQRFDSSGSPAGAVHQVNVYTTDEQEIPDLALFPDGTAMVVWDSEGQDGAADGVFGRRLNASGIPLGAEFQANPQTDGVQDIPRVDVSPSGDRFVVVWQCSGTFTQPTVADCPGTPDAREISARVFAANGTPVSSHFSVNTYTTGIQRTPDVAYLDDGSFAVVWEGQPAVSLPFASTGIHARRFSADGVPIGDQFVVETYAFGALSAPAIGGQSGMGLVTWFSQEIPGTGSPGIAGRVIGSSGPVGDQFPVSTEETLFSGFASDVDEDGAGRFVVVWTGYTGDFSVQQRGPIARQFCADTDGNGSCDQVFRDGFESGDTVLWDIAGR